LNTINDVCALISSDYTKMYLGGAYNSDLSIVKFDLYTE